jgi:hypothetical protein
MTNPSPIPFPPQEKLDQWVDNILSEGKNVDFVLECVWKDGFQTGADQELEACCEWLQDPDLNVDTYKLRAARRPKPLRKEQALAKLAELEGKLGNDFPKTIASLRRALEALPND